MKDIFIPAIALLTFWTVEFYNEALREEGLAPAFALNDDEEYRIIKTDEVCDDGRPVYDIVVRSLTAETQALILAKHFSS